VHCARGPCIRIAHVERSCPKGLKKSLSTPHTANLAALTLSLHSPGSLTFRGGLRSKSTYISLQLSTWILKLYVVLDDTACLRHLPSIHFVAQSFQLHIIGDSPTFYLFNLNAIEFRMIATEISKAAFGSTRSCCSTCSGIYISGLPTFRCPSNHDCQLDVDCESLFFIFCGRWTGQ
jgi:hypothetical protein